MDEICDEIYAHGVCHRENCPYSHDIYSCQTCRVVFETTEEYDRHLVTKKHQQKMLQATKRAAGISIPVTCTLCSVDLYSAAFYTQHSRGKRHARNMQQQGLVVDPGPLEIDVPSHSTRCDTCATNIPTHQLANHLKGRRHANALHFGTLQGALDESEKDKNGIDVTPETVDFGFVNEPRNSNATWSKKLVVQNTNVTGIQIIDARLSSQLTSRTVASG